MEYDPIVDRDVSWLRFNERVLLESENPEVPLLERLKFLAIFSSNLDEFFRVRIAQLRQWKDVDKDLRKKLILQPNRQLKEVLALVKEQQRHFGRAINQLFQALREEGIQLLDFSELKREDRQVLSGIFQREIVPHLKNYGTDHRQHLKDGGLYLWVVPEYGPPRLINIPSRHTGRFIVLREDPIKVCYLDDLIRLFLPDYLDYPRLKGVYSIKLSRDAELYLEDDYTDAELVEKIHRSLHKRSSGQPTRLLYDPRMPEEQLSILKEELDLGEADLIPGGTYHHLSDFFDFPAGGRRVGFVYEDMPPLPHPTLTREGDIIDQILERDHLLHLPYQSFEVVERLVDQAATDPRVERISLTLYRLARTSRLTDSLLKALNNGKEVVLFVEAQARFDEENNIYWGNRFREEGAEVIFSIPQIKVHSKICLIEGSFGADTTALAFIGTGNFNSKTARLYTDHGLFTANSAITFDLSQVFKVLQREIITPRLKELVVSPFTTRLAFIEWIQHEIDQAAAGEPCGIEVKMNSLEDSRMISYLIKAHENGVPIRMLVRGICRLEPRSSKEWGDNPSASRLKITSIVDRFLEHGRIYRFENGGDPRLLIGSADWMTRNLDRRIEVLTPVHQPELRKELEDILRIQFADNTKARRIDGEYMNHRVEQEPGTPPIRSQYAIYEYLKNKY